MRMYNSLFKKTECEKKKEEEMNKSNRETQISGI